MPKLGVAGQSIVSFGITGHQSQELSYPVPRSYGCRLKCCCSRPWRSRSWSHCTIGTVSRSDLVIEVIVNTRITGIRRRGHAKAWCSQGQSIVSFGSPDITITGAVLSCTVIDLLHVDVLPQSPLPSRYVSRCIPCGQAPGSMESLKVMVTVSSQLSVAVAIPKTGTEGHSTGLITSGHVMTGGVVSSTEITCVQAATFPNHLSLSMCGLSCIHKVLAESDRNHIWIHCLSCYRTDTF